MPADTGVPRASNELRARAGRRPWYEGPSSISGNQADLGYGEGKWAGRVAESCWFQRRKHPSVCRSVRRCQARLFPSGWCENYTVDCGSTVPMRRRLVLFWSRWSSRMRDVKQRLLATTATDPQLRIEGIAIDPKVTRRARRQP